MLFLSKSYKQLIITKTMVITLDKPLVFGVAGGLLVGIGFYLAHKEFKGAHELGALVLAIGVIMLALR